MTTKWNDLKHKVSPARRVELAQEAHAELEQMVAEITPENRYPEVSTSAEIGKEVIEWQKEHPKVRP